jgi:PAS domain S-box-containing protein
MALNTYTNVVIAGGVALLALAAPHALHVDPWWFAGLLGLATAAAFFKLSLQLPGGGAPMILQPAGFLGLLILGAHPTAFIIGVSVWMQCTYRPQHRTAMDVRRRLFSIATGIMTVEAAGFVFGVSGGVTGQPTSGPLVAPLAAAALVCFAVNSLLVAGAIALARRERLGRVWYQNFLWSAPGYFVSAAVAGLCVVIADHVGYLTLLLSIVPLYLTYQAYRVYLGRVACTEGIIQSMNEILLVVSPEGLITTTNAAACEALEYGEADLIGRRLSDVIVPPVATDAALLPGSAARLRNVERRLRPRSGADIPILFSTAPMTVSAHGVEGTVCLALDIRERPRIARQARSTRTLTPDPV